MSSTPASRGTRIPLNTLAISFGMAGLASLWSTTAAALDLPPAIPAILWVAAAATWVWLIVAHTVRGSRSADSLLSQLKQPAQGPIAAIVPVVGLMLGAQLHLVWPLGGAVLALLSFVAASLFAGWILAYWHTGRLTPEAFHGAYLLPTVAAPLVASTVAAKLGFPHVAMAAFATGLFFWIVLVTVLLSRLAFFPPLPDPLTPTLAILLAPPGVSLSLLGVLAVMGVMQLFLISVYRRLAFSLGFWSFTFPVASAAGYGIDWLEISDFAGWQIVALALAATATALIAVIGVRSIILVSTRRLGARRAERTLQRADELAQHGPPTGSAARMSPRSTGASDETRRPA
jgi:tellurite resistance protein